MDANLVFPVWLQIYLSAFFIAYYFYDIALTYDLFCLPFT